MTEIVCPNCHTAFKIDESGYAEILNKMLSPNQNTNELSPVYISPFDISSLEEELDQFKTSTCRNLDLASSHLKTTIDDVGKCILQLKKIKDILTFESTIQSTHQLQIAVDKIDVSTFLLKKINDSILISTKNLRLANDKTQDVTVKRLIRIKPKNN